MALRAGYYGLKRSLKDKLFNLAASTPADIGPDNPIAGKNDVLTSIDLLDKTVGWIGKNLFNGKASTKTAQGVTWTVDASDNNIFTVSGTPTGFEAFSISSSKVLPPGSYKLSGLENTVNVAYNGVRLYKNAVEVRVILGGDIDPLIIEQSDDYDTIVIELKRVTNGVACSGTGKIMITTPEQYALDPTYEPYHASVEDTLDVLKKSTLRSNAFANNIAASGDLNTYLTPGTYNCQSSSIAGGLSNCPTNVAFVMDVIEMNTAGTAKMQIIYTPSANYQRQFIVDTFSSWYKYTGTEVQVTRENETKKATKKKVIKEEEE